MKEMQHLNLKWNHCAHNILQASSEFLSSESLVDVTLSSQGHFIRAHKIILSACSPYFKEVFDYHVHKHPLIILKGIKYEDLQSIVKFMYNGEVEVHESALADLLAAAEMLQVKGLSDIRGKYEKGEITSVTPPLKPESLKSEPLKSMNSVAPRQESPAPAAEAPVAMFPSTAPIIPVSHTVGTDLSLTTPASTLQTLAPTLGTLAQSTNPVTRLPAPAFCSPNIGNQAAGSVAPALAIASLIPRNTLLPLPQFNNSSCGTAPSPIPTIPVPTTTSATVPALPTYTALGGPLMSTTSTTPSQSRPIFTCITGNFVNLNATETFAKNLTFSTTNFTPATELHRFPVFSTAPIGNAAAITENKCVADTQPPRTRKRRKMSHVVNELAKEAVFVSNGNVLESDDDVSKDQTTTSKSPTTLSAECFENFVEIEEFKKSCKNPQESLLMKEKWKDTTKVPRPPNAFMIFASAWRRKLAAEFPLENGNHITARLGTMWRQLKIDEKETYQKLAKKADEEYKLKYSSPCDRKESGPCETWKPDLKVTTSVSASSENCKELDVVKTYVNGDDREIIEFTDSSEGGDDDDDDDDDDFTYCAVGKYDCGDDVITEKSSQVQNKPHDYSSKRSTHRGNSSSSNTATSYKTSRMF